MENVLIETLFTDYAVMAKLERELYVILDDKLMDVKIARRCETDAAGIATAQESETAAREEWYKAYVAAKAGALSFCDALGLSPDVLRMHL